jgi:Ala-tRNA(Pro) deacylase
MPISRRLRDYLDENEVKYVSIIHSPAFTAEEVAASMEVKGKDLAKAVMVKVLGREDVMLVLPASRRIEFTKLQQALGGKDARLATEAEFKDLFPECEVGAMPPFGNLYGIRVICDSTLTADEQIAFNAGTHTWAIRMAYADYERLVRPEVAAFTRPIR